VAPRLRWPVYIAGETRDTRVEGCRALGYLTQSEMVEQYARATIYAMPARYEPFGLSILEAALSRCALVLGDIPSLREVWADAALFVAPDDDAALEKTLRLLIENPGLRDRLSGRAYERALQYDTDTMVTAYLEAYANIRVAKEQACGS
jgi:glycosyltransferase involved in cell wall biosynthesis